MSKTISPWTQLDNKLLQKTRVFDLWSKRLRSPSGDYEDDFYYISCVDWANVVAITPANEVVLVEQQRHGIGQATLEIPGGMLHSSSDNPRDAAARELQEETGYGSTDITELGMVHPNPAMLNNRCFFYLARNVLLEQEQNLDPAEDVAVHLIPLDDIAKLIHGGKITHALTIAAFFLYFSKMATATFASTL